MATSGELRPQLLLMLQSWEAVFYRPSGRFGHNVRLRKARPRPVVIDSHPHAKLVAMTTLAYKEVTNIKIVFGESVTVRGVGVDGNSIEETIPVQHFDSVYTRSAVAPEIESLGRELREVTGTPPKELAGGRTGRSGTKIGVSTKRK